MSDQQEILRTDRKKEKMQTPKMKFWIFTLKIPRHASSFMIFKMIFRNIELSFLSGQEMDGSSGGLSRWSKTHIASSQPGGLYVIQLIHY